jgi:hypothetical protein
MHRKALVSERNFVMTEPDDRRGVFLDQWDVFRGQFEQAVCGALSLRERFILLSAIKSDGSHARPELEVVIRHAENAKWTLLDLKTCPSKAIDDAVTACAQELRQLIIRDHGRLH